MIGPLEWWEFIGLICLCLIIGGLLSFLFIESWLLKPLRRRERLQEVWLGQSSLEIQKGFLETGRIYEVKGIAKVFRGNTDLVFFELRPNEEMLVVRFLLLMPGFSEEEEETLREKLQNGDPVYIVRDEHNEIEYWW